MHKFKVVFSFFPVEEKLELVNPVQPVRTYEGCDVTLRCEVSRRTRSMMAWYRNNKLLTPGDRFHYKKEQGIIELYIQRVTVRVIFMLINSCRLF